ncbi:MAG: hypothetical protein ACPLYF_03495 [Fervidobacterium sp.]
MRGLSFPPVLESEVLVLFGMLIPYLDDEFVIEEFNSTPGFPDCFALRNGVKVGIEFEVDSRHFYAHDHHKDPNLVNCNLIICWKNSFGPYIIVPDKNGGSHKIEIIELERVVREKSLFNQLFAKEKPHVPQEWSEEMFLAELRRKVRDEKVHVWINNLIEVCKSSSEFKMASGKGKRQATLGFHIVNWLSYGIGVPTPILFLDNGSISFDCGNMQKIPHVEKELREKINQIRTKKWGRWCIIPIRDESTFNHIKSLLEWLQKTASKTLNINEN